MLRSRSVSPAAILVMVILAAPSCGGPSEESTPEPSAPPEVDYKLTEVATSTQRWTGLAISSDGRIFVSFPRWSEDVPISVGEIVDGNIVPYPDESINAWSPEDGDAFKQFVCAQSLLADEKGALWILDAGNPSFEGVVDGGPKLVRFNLILNRNVGTYRFQYENPEDDVVGKDSYLNDVRVDLDADRAYLTDSGDGAILVTNLTNGTTRRLLDDHPSTRAEEIVLTVGGAEWRRPDGEAPSIHSDGLALSPDRRYLYYQPLTGRTLYRISTKALRDDSLSPEDLGSKVEKVGETGAADGLAFGSDGYLYISALEENAIKRLDPETGETEIVVQDGAISWPDSFALDAKGRMHFTTSQIHLGDQTEEPFRIFRIDEVPLGTE